MASATASAPQPGNEKGRLAGRPNSKLSMLGNNSDTADTTIALRLQRLMGLGAHGHSANLLAALVWGEAA